MKRGNIWISFLFAQKIISISTYTKKLALHYASANKHAIVTPGITLDKLKPCMGSSEFRKKNALGSGPLLLSIGGLVPRKGQDLILKALPKAIEKFPDLTYVIIGKGDSERDLKKICSDLGLEKNVIFWPNWVSDSDLANFYNACDIFALMSRTEGDAVEGFGIVYVEANALGKPVIGGRGGGTPDAVADGKSGFLLDPSDEKGLREKLLLLLGDKKLRDKMGEYGKKFAIGTHQWKDKIAQLETIYQEKVK